MNILRSSDELQVLSDLNFNNNKGVNLANPTSNQDASTKAYVDAQISTVDNTKLSLTGGIMAGLLNFGGLSLTNTSTINQEVNTTSSPTFANVNISTNQNIGPDWRISQVGPHLEVVKNTGTSQYWQFRQGGFINQHGTGGSTGIEYRSSNGTIAVPTATTTGNSITQLLFNGHDGSTYVQTAAIKTESLQNFSVGNTGSKLQFFVTALNTSGMQNIMEMDSTIRPTIPFISSNATASTSSTTGSIVTSGGLGVGGNINFGGLINGTTNGGGYFAQTQTVTVANTVTETSLIGSGQGTLTVPANTFPIAGSYIVEAGGIQSNLNNAQLIIRIYGGPAPGTTLLGTIPTLTIPTATGKWWGISLYFTVRTLGGPGVASLSARATFNMNVDSGNNLFGSSFHTVNNTSFDTTINNTLRITAQWGAADPGNTISMAQCVLTKSY